MSVFGGNSDDNQKNYTWEIRDIEDVNDWMENSEAEVDDYLIADYYKINEIKNSKGTVYQLINNEGAVILSRDLKVIMDRISNTMYEWRISEEGCDEKSEKAVEIHNKYNNYKVFIEEQPELKSNRIIKDLDSANQWLADIGYEGAIRFNVNNIDYDKRIYWKIEVLINNEWKRPIINVNHAIEGINSLVIPSVEIPEVTVGIDKNKITLIDNLETAEKELKTIRSIKDANDWLKSIGKGTEYVVEYAKGNKGVLIQIRKDNSIVYSSKEIEKVVDKLVEEIQGARPLCKNTILDITTLNLWLDTIDFKSNGKRRPYIFKKKTENNNIYSVWDLYKDKDKTETKLEFINTSLQISLGYIVVTRKLKNYLWDVQLKKENVKKVGNITIDSLESANKWLASLGYGNHIKFNCKLHVQNTPKGKVRYTAYYLQERLSGDNWKLVNNTYGKFNDILNLFCKLTNITDIPKCTIVFTPQLVEEQKEGEVIQSVKGANIWFDKINIQGCKFRIKSREDKQNKRLYTIEFMNPQGQIGKFYECASLKESILYFCRYYKIKAPAVANM